MATVKIFARLKYEGQTQAFYDISPRVDYENLSWESNSEGTSATATIKLWTILPAYQGTVYDYSGATFADKLNAAILDESFVIEIPNKTEVIIFDTSTSPDTVLFSGVVTRVSTSREGGTVTQNIECADNTAMLEEHIVADYYAPRDSRDIDIITGSTETTYTLAGALPAVVGQVDGLSATSQSTGGSLTDGTYEIRAQALSTTIPGRDGQAPQIGPVTKPYTITLSAGTSTQSIKVKWKTAGNANRHRIYIVKTAGSGSSSESYLARESRALLSSIKITSASRSSNIVTIQTESSHGLSVGDPIVVSIPQTPGFSVAIEDYVVINSVPAQNRITYKNNGEDGAASITNAILSSGGAAYISSYSTTQSPEDIYYGSPRGYADGEMYKLTSPASTPASTQTLSGNWFDSGYYRLGVGKDNIRSWLYPVSVFGGLFEKTWLSQIGLDVTSAVEAVDTQYRFSPYLPESDTANAEQYGGRTVRNVLDYISEKTGAEYWVDRGQLDGSGNYSCKLHYRAKTPKELVFNGMYDGNIDGWTTASGFSLQSSTSGPYGHGYTVLSSTSNTSIETSTDKRVPTSVGKKYFVSVRGHVSDHQNRWGAYVDWYNSAGAEISSTHIGNLTGESVHSWERIWKIVEVPANAVSFGLRGTCTTQQHGSASFTDWSAIEITGQMAYGDFEDSVSYAVPVYEMEVPSSPVESGASVNRLHLYAVFRTKDENGNKVALTDGSGNPVQYVDYDFVPGIWATNGKIVEAAITDERVETLEDAELAAEGFWKENGLPIESYTFEMRPSSASGSTYPVPEVGQVIPFLWTLVGVAKPLIVKSVQARMMGMDVVYTITVGGDIRLQRSAFIRLSEKIKELDDVNPVPPVPDTPTDVTVSANEKMISLSWRFDQDVEINKNLSSFELQRQDAIFKEIATVSRSGSTVTVETETPHGMVANDTVRIEIDSEDESILSLNGQWVVSQTYTNSFEYVCLESGTIDSVDVDGYAYYNFNDFRTIQNTNATYANDTGLITALQYRYRVRAISTDGTFSKYSDPTNPTTPNATQIDIGDGSITIDKLESSLRPLQIISGSDLPDIANSAALRARYPEGMIVYHLGGTPPGLRKVAVGGTTWENAINTSDVVVGSITTGLISAAGIDASVLKAGKITIDNRWGETLGTRTLYYKYRSGSNATVWTLREHGVTETGLTINIAGAGTGFDGARTISELSVPTSRKAKNGTTGAISLNQEHAISPGQLVTITGIDTSMNLTDVPAEHTDEDVTHKTKWGSAVSVRTLNWHAFDSGNSVTITGADTDANTTATSIGSILNATALKAQGVPTALGTDLVPTQGQDTYATLVSTTPHSVVSGDSVEILATGTAGINGTRTAHDFGSAVEDYSRVSNVATIRTSRYHGISANETIVVSGLGSPYDGVFTATRTDSPIIRTQAFNISSVPPSISVVSGLTTQATGTTSVQVTPPAAADLKVGDLIVCAVASDESTGTQHATTSVGWVKVGSNTGGSDPSVSLFSYTVQSGVTVPTLVVTGTSTATVARTQVFRSSGSGRTIALSTYVNTGNTVDPGLVTVPGSTQNAVILTGLAIDDVNVTSVTPPAGYSLLGFSKHGTNTSGTNATIALATKTLTTATSDDPGVWAYTPSDTVATFAIAVYDSTPPVRYGIFSTSTPVAFKNGDYVSISGAASDYNGGKKVVGTGASIISYQVTSNVVTITTAMAHGILSGDTVKITGLPVPYSGSFIATVPSGNNPSTFTYSLNTPNVALTAASGIADTGKNFYVYLAAGSNINIATTTAAYATNYCSVTYTLPISAGTGGSPVALVPVSDTQVLSGAKVDNGKTLVVSGLTAAFVTPGSASGGSFNNYRTINYTHATSAATPVSLTSISPYASATTGRTIRLFNLSAGDITPQSDTNGTVSNGRVIRFTSNSSGSVPLTQITGTVEIKVDDLAISSPNFTVDFDGRVTASDITITGGGINFGSGDFQVSNSGAVTAANIDVTGGSITGGSININDAFTVDTAGAVSASDITITGGSLSIGGNFDVSNGGTLTAVDAVMQNVNLNPSGAPALYVSASGAEGDFAVPSGESVTFGEWNGSSLTKNMVLNETGGLLIRGTLSTSNSFSDADYKKNISLYQIDPSAIDKINIYSFEWDLEKVRSEGYFTPSKEGVSIGVIAQEIASVLPSAMTPKTKDTIAGIDIYQIAYALISSLKDARARLSLAESKIAELENRK